MNLAGVLAAVAGGALLVVGVLWWLWRRERRLRQAAEAAAKTHRVRADAAKALQDDYAASNVELREDLDRAQGVFVEKLKALDDVKARIDAVAADDDDGWEKRAADEWNRLMGREA